MISAGTINKYKDFYNYLLLVRGVRESTATFYVQKVGVLFRLSPRLTKAALEDSMATLKATGAKNSYLNKLREVSRVYCDFLKYSGQAVDEGIYTVKKLKEEAVMRATMSDDEIEAFLLVPPKRSGPKETNNHLQWTLFFKILAFTGARPHEIAKLTVDLVDFGRRVLIVPSENSKTHTSRYIPIPPNIIDELSVFCKNKEGYLFESRNGGNARFGVGVYSNTQWCYQFHERRKAIGLNRKGLCVYSLRHSLITRLLEEDVNIFKVQKIVGHKRLETTAGYTHMTTKDIQLAITKHPLIRKATNPIQILGALKEIIRSFEFEKNNKFTFNMNESNKGLTISIRIV